MRWKFKEKVIKFLYHNFDFFREGDRKEKEKRGKREGKEREKRGKREGKEREKRGKREGKEEKRAKREGESTSITLRTSPPLVAYTSGST
jgi:hypothetical protein